MGNSQKDEIMNKCMEQIAKKYANSSVGKYSEIGKNLNIKKLTTTSLAADYVLGGGFARITEILGFPSAGKTTLALTTIAHVQKENPDAKILFVDAEYSLDPVYATSLGVDLENLYICQPDSSEEGYNIMEMFIQSGAGDLVVLDSIAAMVPSEYVEKEIGQETKIASFARLTTQAIARLNRLSAQFDTPIIFINQYKDAVSVNGIPGGSGTVMGNTTKYSPGGPSKDFYFQQIIEIKRAGQIKEKDENGVEQVVANVIQMTTLKNKVAPPYRRGQFTIKFGKGLDRVQELVGLGLTQGLIKQGGAFYTFLDLNGEPLLEKPINGRSNVVKFLEDPENAEFTDKFEEMLKTKINDIPDTGTNKVEIDKGEE